MTQNKRIFSVELAQIETHPLIHHDYAIKISFCEEFETLPSVYYWATGKFINDQIKNKILEICPWFQSGTHVLSSRVYVYGRHHPTLNIERMEKISAILHEELEQAACKHWIYLGVPSLEELVRKKLRKSMFRTHALIEHQTKYGYDDTKKFVNQFEDIFA